MDSTFYGASSFSRDLSAWDVGSVKDMRNMLFNALCFCHDPSHWADTCACPEPSSSVAGCPSQSGCPPEPETFCATGPDVACTRPDVEGIPQIGGTAEGDDYTVTISLNTAPITAENVVVAVESLSEACTVAADSALLSFTKANSEAGLPVTIRAGAADAEVEMGGIAFTCPVQFNLTSRGNNDEFRIGSSDSDDCAGTTTSTTTTTSTPRVTSTTMTLTVTSAGRNLGRWGCAPEICGAGASACTDCEAGKFGSAILMFEHECTKCPAGSACAAGATAPEVCADGSYCPTSSGVEVLPSLSLALSLPLPLPSSFTPSAIHPLAC